MRKYLIASHGTFSSGIKSSLDMIIGETNNVHLINGYVSGNKSIEEDLFAILQQVREDDELIVFSDLTGGSITNQVLRLTQGKNVHVVSGFNLALVIEVLMADSSEPAAALIESAITNAKEQIVYVNKLMINNSGENND